MKRKLNSDEKLVLSTALLVLFLAWLAVVFGLYEMIQAEKHPHPQQQTANHA